MDDIEWLIHHISRNIDNAMSMIDREQEWARGHRDIHYHSCEKYTCTEDTLRIFGGCAGPSPYALLKNVLESAMKTLNKDYPTTPLNELPCKEDKPIVPPKD